MESVDYLIVGAGLAGITIAYELQKQGYSIKIIQEDRKGQSSTIASGLINPITGKRFVKTWNWDLLESTFTEYYGSIEKHLNLKLLYPVSIRQILKSIEEENQWLSRCDDEHYQKLISFPGERDERSGKPFGLIQKAYRLDIEELLTKLRHYFDELNVFDRNAFDFKDLKIESSNAIYKQMRIHQHVIFAEGHWIKWNPYFSYLPSFAVKGERFCFDLDASSDEIYKHQYTLIPLTQSNRYWCGSNYIFDDHNPEPTQAEKQNQFQFLHDYYHIAEMPTDYKVGIRPAMKDRRPVVGKHPSYPMLVCLNGYGTKGASVNPFCVLQLTQHLNQQQELTKEINIARFNKYLNS